jgi:hypothetical protein
VAGRQWIEQIAGSSKEVRAGIGRGGVPKFGVFATGGLGAAGGPALQSSRGSFSIHLVLLQTACQSGMSELIEQTIKSITYYLKSLSGWSAVALAYLWASVICVCSVSASQSISLSAIVGVNSSNFQSIYSPLIHFWWFMSFKTGVLLLFLS